VLSMSVVAKRHADLVRKMIHSSENRLGVITKPTKAAAAGSSLFADLVSDPTGTILHSDITCIWYDARALPADSSGMMLSILGQYPEATALARVWLADVLVDADSPYGETLFDTATAVQYVGKLYRVVATERHGLANVSPYTMTVVLSEEATRRV
jgi:hypothetical protein